MGPLPRHSRITEEEFRFRLATNTDHDGRPLTIIRTPEDEERYIIRPDPTFVHRFRPRLKRNTYAAGVVYFNRETNRTEMSHGPDKAPRPLRLVEAKPCGEGCQCADCALVELEEQPATPAPTAPTAAAPTLGPGPHDVDTLVEAAYLHRRALGQDLPQHPAPLHMRAIRHWLHPVDATHPVAPQPTVAPSALSTVPRALPTGGNLHPSQLRRQGLTEVHCNGFALALPTVAHFGIVTFADLTGPMSGEYARMMRPRPVFPTVDEATHDRSRGRDRMDGWQEHDMQEHLGRLRARYCGLGVWRALTLLLGADAALARTCTLEQTALRDEYDLFAARRFYVPDLVTYCTEQIAELLTHTRTVRRCLLELIETSPPLPPATVCEDDNDHASQADTYINTDDEDARVAPPISLVLAFTRNGRVRRRHNTPTTPTTPTTPPHVVDHAVGVRRDEDIPAPWAPRSSPP